MGRREHWEDVYRQKAPNELSWYQSHPDVSVELIQATGAGPDTRILDVGGGASLLVDRLLGLGLRRLGVLDLSSTALQVARERLGTAANTVEWIEEDVLTFTPSHRWGVWHDRAVFHFLIDPADRMRYRSSMYRSVPRGGHVVIATFGPEGPTHCSGLETLRCTADDILAELGPAVELVEHRTENHRTPSGALQEFVYARLMRT